LNEGRYGEVQVLSPAGIAEMQRPAASAGKMLSVPLGHYAMGWFARPDPIQLGIIIPRALRALWLIPLVQVFALTATLLRMHGWRKYPDTRPASRRTWVLHVLAPIIPNLLLAVVPVLTFAKGRAGFLFLFAPDFSWLALLCGGFAAIWMCVRTSLTLRVFRKDRSLHGFVHRLVRTGGAGA
jgi:hypothetical protein